MILSMTSTSRFLYIFLSILFMFGEGQVCMGVVQGGIRMGRGLLQLDIPRPDHLGGEVRVSRSVDAMAAKMQANRGEASSPALDQQSSQVFENLAKKLHRLESKLGVFKGAAV